MEDMELVLGREIRELNSLRDTFHWMRFDDAEVRPEGYRRKALEGAEASDFLKKDHPAAVVRDSERLVWNDCVFVGGDAFCGRRSPDPANSIIAPSIGYLHGRDIERASFPQLISAVRAIRTEEDALSVAKAYGPLRIEVDIRGSACHVRCDTLREWMDISIQIDAVLSLLESIERGKPSTYIEKDPALGPRFHFSRGDGRRSLSSNFIFPREKPSDLELARGYLADMMTTFVGAAAFKGRYRILPTGGIVSELALPFDLHAAIWKTIDATVVESSETSYLRLRQCHYCGEWDFEKEGEGGRRIRQRSDKAFWYHDGCKRIEDKRMKDAARAEREERERKSRPGARKESPFD